VQLCPALLCSSQQLNTIGLLRFGAQLVGARVGLSEDLAADSACLAEQAASGCFSALATGERVPEVQWFGCDKMRVERWQFSSSSRYNPQTNATAFVNSHGVHIEA